VNDIQREMRCLTDHVSDTPESLFDRIVELESQLSDALDEQARLKDELSDLQAA
jgi:predicted  nucleic acid-binding Zn-ribbon protein